VFRIQIVISGVISKNPLTPGAASDGIEIRSPLPPERAAGGGGVAVYVAFFLVAAGILALLFYVVYVVNPKRVEVSAKLGKLAEVNFKADGDGRGPGKAAGEITPLEPVRAENLVHGPDQHG
jgi:hypothetical protein